MNKIRDDEYLIMDMDSTDRLVTRIEKITKPEHWMTTANAAKTAQVTIPTIIRWCIDLEIGSKVGGRWRISARKLKKVTDGSLYREYIRWRPKK